MGSCLPFVPLHAVFTGMLSCMKKMLCGKQLSVIVARLCKQHGAYRAHKHMMA